MMKTTTLRKIPEKLGWNKPRKKLQRQKLQRCMSEERLGSKKKVSSVSVFNICILLKIKLLVRVKDLK